MNINWKKQITLEEGKRNGQPCIRGLRITVGDILNYLAFGMSYEEILFDFLSLHKADILASIAYAAYRQNRR